MKTNEYLDAVKLRHGLTSDYQLAKLLKKTHTSISGYRHGRSSMDATTALKIAEVLALDPLQVIADSEIERARRDDVKKVWMRYAAAFVMTLGFSGIAPPPASATTLHNSFSQPQNIHYARTGRRKKTANSAISAMTATLAASLGLHTLAP